MALTIPPEATILGSTTYPHRQYHGMENLHRYAHPSGNDVNDGLTWGTAKKTILGAYDALGSGGGVVEFVDGVHVGGEVAGQGIWLMESDDPNYSAASYNSGSYPGWRKAKSVSFIGQSANGVSYVDGGDRIYPGQSADTTWTGPWIWLAGQVASVSFIDISCANGTGGYGIDHARYSNGSAATGVGGYGGDNVLFRNVRSFCTAANALNGASCYRIGNTAFAPFWWIFENCDGYFPTDEPTTTLAVSAGASTQMTSESFTMAIASPTDFPAAAPFVIQFATGERCLVTAKAGTTWTVTRGYEGTKAVAHNTSELVYFDPEDTRRAIFNFQKCYLFNIGTVVQTFGNTHLTGCSRFNISDVSGENCSGPVVVVDDSDGILIDGVEQYDQHAYSRGIVTVKPMTNSPERVVVRGTGTNGFRDGGLVVGPAIVQKTPLKQAGSWQSIPAQTTPLSLGNVGFHGRRILGQSDAARRAFGPTVAMATNLMDQTGSTWAGLADGSAAVTTAQAGPDRSTNAVALAGSDSVYRGIYSGAWNPAVPSTADGRTADFLLWGIWIKGSVVFDVLRVAVTAGALTFAEGPFVETEAATSLAQDPTELGFGQWSWLAGYAKARVGGSSTIKLRIYGDVTVCYPVLFTLAGYHEAEIAEIVQHLPTWPDTVPAGALTTKRGQKLIAWDGLGVGNSAAATTPGSVVKKMEVFNAAGASLGFVPIYNSIT